MILGRVKIDVSGIRAVVSEAKKRNITLRGAKAAAKILKVAARAAAPRRKRSGALKQSQAVKAVKGRKGSTISFAVQGARKKFFKMVILKGRKTPMRVVPAFYDHLVQLGTKPHSLAKGAKVARRTRRGETKEVGQGGGGRHPGTRANPYRKRAWAASRHQAAQAAVAAMGLATQKEIARQAAKVAAKAKAAR